MLLSDMTVHFQTLKKAKKSYGDTLSSPHPPPKPGVSMAPKYTVSPCCYRVDFSQSGRVV